MWRKISLLVLDHHTRVKWNFTGFGNPDLDSQIKSIPETASGVQCPIWDITQGHNYQCFWRSQEKGMHHNKHLPEK